MNRSDWPALLRRASEIPRFLFNLARWGRPKRALLFGPLSLGDDLLCTAVLHEARKRGAPLTMMTARPELFQENPDPVSILPIDGHYVQGLRHLGSEITCPYYVRPDPENAHRDLLPPHHIIAEMCRLAGLTGTVSLRPYLHLTPAERQSGRRVKRQVAIHSTGLNAALPYPTKEWGVNRFAAVAQLLAGEFELVQLGSARDALLPGVLDLRGRTTLREAAAILAESICFVGLEGFLPHLARAVDCPSVVIFGGRARPETFGYPANLNLISTVACAPCGLRDACPYEMRCMAEILPNAVANAVHLLASRPRGNLPTATATLP